MVIMGFTGDAPMVLYEGLLGNAGYHFRCLCLSSGILAHLPRRHPILLGIVFETRDGHRKLFGSVWGNLRALGIVFDTREY